MTEELKVVLRRSEHSGFGFSLLGTTGPPHVIYDIVENSPAADCGSVEAGDIIVKVNGTDVHRYTTKEVLKCLRLSDDLVTLELKRDPKLKAKIKEQLANTKGPHYADIEPQNIYDYKGFPSPSQSRHIDGSVDTHNYNSNSADSAISPVGRYKSPTHLSHRQNSNAPSSNHSRSSSGSSAKIQIGDTITNSTSPGLTSPTCRPSRIPTALKSTQKLPIQHSPQNKRPRPSQIPKSSNGNGTTVIGTSASNTHHIQHSNSYSGTTSRFQQYQQQKDRESEPISAPPQPAKAPRFEAYMMTGDLILNLSRTPQNSDLIPAHTKKIDSLRDSPNRSAINARANGALAPRASGESSPSSSSVDSPTHTISSGDSTSLQKQQQHKLKNRHRNQEEGDHHYHNQQSFQQCQRDSINNSYNNSNSCGGGDRQYRKDSLTNDTLLLCEELDRDDEDETEHILDEEATDRQRRQRQQHRHQQRQYEQYQNEEENEEDQTHYDITNIETYNSAGVEGGDEASDRQCLVMQYGDGDNGIGEGEAYSQSTAKQRLRALKYKAASSKHHRATGGHSEDFVDCVRHPQQQYRIGSGSSSSSATVKSEGIGANTSQDETSFSVPTSPTSLSTPLIDKETANSVPTSPEPTSLGATAGGGGVGPGGSGINSRHPDTSGVVRRHNGVVRKCDSAGFRTSKSEDHLQQIQREGIAAVIPIDIDEDVNSSLNTLLDTRQDSEDSQQTTTTSTTITTANPECVIKTNLSPSSKELTNNECTTNADVYEVANLQRPCFKRQRNVRIITPRIIVKDCKPIHNKSGMNHEVPDTTREFLKKASNRDRIVWTYNAPLQPHQLQQHHQHSIYGQNSTPNSHSSSISSSPQHSAESPASPTSVSSSVMSSSGSKGALGVGGAFGMSSNGQQLANNNGTIVTTMTMTTTTMLLQCPLNGGGSGGGFISSSGAIGDHSVSEAISNISSPDYQDDDNLLSSRDLLGGMVLSDPSDSDSTILVSDTAAAQRQQHNKHQQKQHQRNPASQQSEHKLVIQVRGIDSSNSPSSRSAYSELKDSEDEVITLTDEHQNTVMAASGGENKDSSPPISDDGSDVESLHSYHYSPKAVDMPSAIRLAKRLYSLDGFKKSDVSRHLSKNNDFSRAVADEYLKYFNFEKKTLDQSLREFLQQFSLSGETQERERVLVHFSKRFLDCNPGSFNSQDAVHTLTCAIMLLNTDLHGPNIGRKMTSAEFVENLADLNDGDNFPKDVLKYLYQAIKTQPLEWALDEESTELHKQRTDNNVGGTGAGGQVGQNPFLDIPESPTAVEYKKGYVMRKCCYDSNYKKTPFGKRSWKMFYCTLRDLVLYLHKDEHGFRKSQMSDNLHNAIRIHHALATKAADYTKKQHVFRLQTADQAEYLFQTSDSKELQSWVETINLVCAAYSAPPLEGGVGSQKRFQRPLLPSAHTKLSMREQLESHEKQLSQLESALMEHKRGPIPSKGLPLQNFKEKDSYLQYELRRYKAYVSILGAKLLSDQQQQLEQQLQQLPSESEEVDTFPMNIRLTQSQPQSPTSGIVPQQQQQTQPQQSVNRWWLCGCCSATWWL